MMAYPQLLGGSFDIQGYPLATVLAEKLVTMLELADANTFTESCPGDRPRDHPAENEVTSTPDVAVIPDDLALYSGRRRFGRRREHARLCRHRIR